MRCGRKQIRAALAPARARAHCCVIGLFAVAQHDANERERQLLPASRNMHYNLCIFDMCADDSGCGVEWCSVLILSNNATYGWRQLFHIQCDIFVGIQASGKSLLLLCDMVLFCEWPTLVELPIKGHIKTFMTWNWPLATFVWSEGLYGATKLLRHIIFLTVHLHCGKKISTMHVDYSM
jgi:hypothetical protein